MKFSILILVFTLISLSVSSPIPQSTRDNNGLPPPVFRPYEIAQGGSRSNYNDNTGRFNSNSNQGSSRRPSFDDSASARGNTELSRPSNYGFGENRHTTINLRLQKPEVASSAIGSNNGSGRTFSVNFNYEPLVKRKNVVHFSDDGEGGSTRYAPLTQKIQEPPIHPISELSRRA